MRTKQLTLFAVLLLSVLPIGLSAQDEATQTTQLTFDLVKADGFNGVDPRLMEAARNRRMSRVAAELQRLFEFDGYQVLGSWTLNVVASTVEPQRLLERVEVTDSAPLELLGSVGQPFTPGGLNSVNVILREVDSSVELMNVSVVVRQGQTIVLVSPGGAFILVVSAGLGARQDR